MAVARLRFLQNDEEELIHQRTIECLSEIGVKVHSPTVLKILEDGGANVDYRAEIARLPEKMIEEAIEKAPKKIRLCARDPKNDIELPVDSYPHITSNGGSVYMTNLETGEKRDTTRKDLADFAKLTDSLDIVEAFWPQVNAFDVPPASHEIHELWTSFKNCTKHVQGDSVNTNDAKTQVALASNIVGSEDELRKRPIFSAIACPIAPLSFEKGSVEGQVELARAGIPIVSMSMSLSGMSSPVTVAGTIVNANAENLASLVISQFAAFGAPHIYSAESTPIDMSSGQINYFAPEMPLISAALAQMAKRYDRPCMVGGWGNGGDKPGLPYSFPELASVGLSTMAGTDIMAGVGGLEAAKGASLEQVIIDAYLWEDYRALMRNFRINDDTIALDITREVGQGNTFLTHIHTARNFKNELFTFNKNRRDWWSTLSTDMVKKAREIVKKKLKEHEVVKIDSDVVIRCEALIKSYEKSVV